MTKEERNPIDIHMYSGIKIETPFEHYTKQRRLNIEAMNQQRERDIELSAELLQLKYDEHINKHS